MYQSILNSIISEDSSCILWINTLLFQSLAPKTRDNILTTAILYVCTHVLNEYAPLKFTHLSFSGLISVVFFYIYIMVFSSPRI